MKLDEIGSTKYGFSERYSYVGFYHNDKPYSVKIKRTQAQYRGSLRDFCEGIRDKLHKSGNDIKFTHEHDLVGALLESPFVGKVILVAVVDLETDPTSHGTMGIIYTIEEE